MSDAEGMDVLAGVSYLPQFDTVEEERLHRKQRLAAAFRLFGRFGFDEGVAGHITARDPEHLDHFWVNPFGMDFSTSACRDLILVERHGRGRRGRRGRSTRAAFAIHSQVHAARPDVIAAAHAHSIYGKSWSTLGRLLDPLTQDACAFYDDHALFDDYTGVVLDLEEGKRIAHALGEQQGGHPAQPRPAHRRPLGRRGGVVVHHDGALVPGAAARRGGRHAGARSTRTHGAAHRRRQVGSPPRGLVQLPAAVRQDHRRAARPPRLSPTHALLRARSVPCAPWVTPKRGQAGSRGLG